MTTTTELERDLRLIALETAARVAGGRIEQWDTQSVVEHAQAYFAFLTGKTATAQRSRAQRTSAAKRPPGRKRKPA